MRLWVKHDERRPDPEPLRTNDRLAFAVGLAGWAIALIITLGMLALPDRVDPVGGLVTIGVGLALGVTGYLVSAKRP